MSNDVATSVRIQLVVEIPGSSYGPDWTLAAIIAQAKDEAPQNLRNRIGRDNSGIKIIGEPKVSVVMSTPV